MKPGLIGPNQILGRNEEELYPPGVDPKRYYIDEILPPKIDVDLEYIKQWLIEFNQIPEHEGILGKFETLLSL